jgi:S1-C subfamily serine protease
MILPLELPPLQLGPKPIRPDRQVEPHAMVEKVDPGSLGEEIGIRPGDELFSINGARMEDVIDYRFLIAEEEVEIVIAPGGRREEAHMTATSASSTRTGARCAAACTSRTTTIAFRFCTVTSSR